MGETGLLDFLKSPEGQGLLAAGFGAAAGRGTRMQAIGQGGLAGLLAYGRAGEMQADQARQKAQDERADTMFGWQKNAYQQQQDALAKAQAQQAAQQNYLGSIGQVTSPRLDAQPNQFDPIKWRALGGSLDEAQKLAGMGDWGRAEVARTVEGQDAQGNKVTLQFDKFGRQVGDGVQGYTAPVQVDLGGRVQFVKPQAGVNLTKTMTPDAVAANAVARGNLAVAQQRLALDQQGKPDYKDGQWVMPPRDMKPGESRAATPATGAKDANDVLFMVRKAREILPKATGSYGGALVDQGARFFGNATEGAKASAQLKALEGSLIAKMPKMSGPQSDADARRYEQAVGQIGDPTIPAAQKAAALDVVEEIQTRYASGQSGAASTSSKPANPTTGLRFLGFE